MASQVQLKKQQG
jgi:prefoldin subunit 2